MAAEMDGGAKGRRRRLEIWRMFIHFDARDTTTNTYPAFRRNYAA